jgi:hypothetical protein
MTDNATYSVFYKMNLRFVIDESETVYISNGDVVSLSILNQYDIKTFPMIRLRLYSDISLLQKLTKYPDALELRGSLDGGVYRIINNESPELIKPTKSISLSFKVYFEFKNTPTSEMDQYQDGIKKKDDLNVNNKVPIEVYCYNYNLIHSMKDQPQQVWKNMSLPTIITSMLNHCGIVDTKIDVPHNQKRYNQILIPNLSMLESLSYFDTVFGLYRKGGIIFGGIDKLYLCDLDSNNGTTPIPIYVKSYKDNSDLSGVLRTPQGYFMQTEAACVSVLSESDIEKVLTSETIIATNVNTLDIKREDLPALKDNAVSHNGLVTSSFVNTISPAILLHKSPNEYVATVTAARINEKITRIDMSGCGFDITKFNPDSRYNLIFESPIRGINMADAYRASYVCHIISPTSQELFSASTTLSLCKN